MRDGLATIVPSRAPFCFRRTLDYLQRRPGELVDQVHGDRYRRMHLIAGVPALVEARATGDDRRPALDVRLLSGPLDALPAAAAVLRASFGLDDDLDAFSAAVAGDPVLARLVASLAGLRLVRTGTAFEALVWAVIGQQISLSVAYRLKAALVRAFGVSLTLDGQTSWAFPTAEALSCATAPQLAALGLGARKAETILLAARQVTDGSLDLDALRRLPRETALARLQALRGVGPWTAAYTLLRGVGALDVCPAGDLGLRREVGRLFGDGATASAATVSALAERWGAWRGYVAFYLWNARARG